MTIRRAVLVPVAVLVVAALWGFARGDGRSFQLAKNMDIFNSIVKELELFYVDSIDPNKTIREGIDAMLYSLDPYTNYFPEEDQSELEQMLKNSYGGIGSIITWNAQLKRSMIAEPYEGMDRIEFVLSTRGQGLNEPANTYGDWAVYGLGDRDSFYYRGAFMDLIRAIDFVCTLPEVDQRYIFAEGGSQGGIPGDGLFSGDDQ